MRKNSLINENTARELPLGTVLPLVKECRSCGERHAVVLTDAVICKEGYLWMQCTCNSTLTIKPQDMGASFSSAWT